MSPLMTLMQLGQLIDARQTQEAADGRDAGIERELLLPGPLHLRFGMVGEILVEAFFRAEDHGAELEAPEGLTVFADPLMPEENRSAVDRHQGRNRDEKRNTHDEQQRGGGEDRMRA